MNIIIIEAKCQNCTATCCGYEHCDKVIIVASRTVIDNYQIIPELPKDIPINDPIRIRNGNDSKDYWKSPVDRRFRRGGR